MYRLRKRRSRRMRTIARHGRQVGVLSAVISIVMLLTLQASPPASALSPCSLDPDPVSRTLCTSASGVVGSIPGVPTPGSIVGGVIDTAAQTAMVQITTAEAHAVSNVLQNEMGYLNSSTTPNFNQQWYLSLYGLVFGMAVFLAFIMFGARFSVAVKDANAGEAAMAIASMVLFGTVGALLPLIVAGLVTASDGALTQAFLDNAGQSAQANLNQLATNMAKNLDPNSIFLPLVVLFLAVMGGVVVLLELAFRAGALYVFTAAEIIGLAMLVGGRLGMETFKRITFGLIGLVLFKPIMAFILVVGVKLTAAPSAYSFLVGAVTLLLTPILSWSAYKGISKHDIPVGRWASSAGQKAKMAATLFAAA